MIELDELRGGNASDAARQAPHPEHVEPQLATRAEPASIGAGWIHERKLDGVRLIVHVDGRGVRLVTRTGLDRVSTFPELTPALRCLTASSDLVADGEVVALDRGTTSFGLLQRRLGRTIPRGAPAPDPPVHLYLFDLLYLEGWDLREVPLLTRKALLCQLSFSEPVRYTEHRADDARDHLAEACRSGWEGLIAKRADASYRSGRTSTWRKLPCYRSGEFIVGGWTDPRGGRTGFGALLLGRFEAGRLRYVGRVGTGFDDRTLEILAAHLRRSQQPHPAFDDPPAEPLVHWCLPHLVLEVRFAGWTEAGRLRHATLLRMRPDLEPSAAVGEGS